MDEKYKVSVIMSCYNAGMTLSKAIESVINNSYRNIELLIIDDSSTDDSLTIAKEFTNKDSRIRIIEHKENLGAGISRKDGIENSTGDYVCFCDSDDELLKDHIKNLIEAAIKYDADITTSGYTVIDDNNREERKADKLTILEKDNKYAVLKADVLRFLNPSLISKRLWDKVTYSTRRYIEDSPTLIKLIWYANKRVILPESTYLYYQNANSLTHIEDPFREILYQILCIIDTYKFFKEEINKPEYLTKASIVPKLDLYLMTNPTEKNKIEFSNEINEIKRFILEFYEEKFE